MTEDEKVGLVAATGDEVDLYSYLETLWRYRGMILGLITVAIIIAAALCLWVIPPRYEAVAFIQVANLSPVEKENGQVAIDSIEGYKAMLLSPQVAGKLPANTRVRAEIVSGSSVIKATVQGETPREAERWGTLWYNELFKQALVARIARLEKELVLQREIAEELKKELVPAYSIPAYKTGTPVIIQDGGETLTLALVELAETEVLLQRARENKLDDIVLVSPFKAGGKVGPSLVLTVGAAAVLALFLGMFAAAGLEGWRGYKQRASA